MENKFEIRTKSCLQSRMLQVKINYNKFAFLRAEPVIFSLIF